MDWESAWATDEDSDNLRGWAWGLVTAQRTSKQILALIWARRVGRGRREERERKGTGGGTGKNPPTHPCSCGHSEKTVSLLLRNLPVECD